MYVGLHRRGSCNLSTPQFTLKIHEQGRKLLLLLPRPINQLQNYGIPYRLESRKIYGIFGASFVGMPIAILVKCAALESSGKVAIVCSDAGGPISVTLVKTETTGTCPGHVRHSRFGEHLFVRSRCSKH